jgi:hypothetical protein
VAGVICILFHDKNLFFIANIFPESVDDEESTVDEVAFGGCIDEITHTLNSSLNFPIIHYILCSVLFSKSN